MIGTARVSSNRSKRNRRNPFPDEYFFAVPLCLLDRGLVHVMTGSEVKRYLTLLRLSNYHYGSQKIRATLAELRKRDGVSERRAWDVNGKLQERGLITVENTKPTSYFLVPPDCWRKVDGTGACHPPVEGKKAQAALEPLHWKDIGSGD